ANLSLIVQISACAVEKLILFDLDGTLTRTQNVYLPFNEAILKTFGVGGDIRSVLPEGNTDPQSVREIFAKANVQKEMHDSNWEQVGENLRHSCSSALSAGATTVRARRGATELL